MTHATTHAPRLQSRRHARHLVALAALASMQLAASAVRAQAPADRDQSPRPAAPAGAPDLADDAVLAQLIEESLAARPELAQAQASARAERERVPQAGALPDPTLQLGIQNDGFRGIEVGRMETSFYSISASQTFPWPGKRRLRSEIAELDAATAGENANRVRLSTVAEVRRGYLDLLLTRERLTLLDRLDALWTQSAAAARARYEAGEGAQSDVLRAQLEVNRIQQRRWALQALERAQLEALNRLRGHPLDEAIASGSRLHDAELPMLGDEAASAQRAVERSPELAAARASVSQASRSIDLAHKSYYPDLSVSAGVMPRGGQFEPMWQLGIGGTMPVFAGSRQSRAVKEAEARELSSRKNVEAVEQVVRLRASQRGLALRALADTVRLYREGLLVQSQATATSTLAQYGVGKASFASVLEAIAGYVNDEDGLLQSLADARRVAIADAEVSLDAPPFATASAGGMAGGAMAGAGAAPAAAAPRAQAGKDNQAQSNSAPAAGAMSGM